MPTFISNFLLRGQRVGLDKAVVGKAPDPDKDKEGIDITVAIFFDGTLNNRYNTAARLNKLAAANRYGGAGTSYANFYSNVSILESINRKRDLAQKQIAIYIEGEGTDYETAKDGTPKFEGDSLKGYAFGSGDTGIPAKVKKGMDKIRTIITRPNFYNPQKETIREIKIHVFGFSRGAAAARHFVARRAELSTWMQQQKKALVSIKFVGLFDTVSSYHPSMSLSPDFNNDVEELHLRIAGNAKKVVHLTAGDEHRKNFASTTVSSSIAASIGYECQLPGAHSDIGGGYGEVEVEERNFASTAEMERLEREGWYIRSPDKRKNQFFTHEEVYSSLSEDAPIVAHWPVGRRTVRHEYQFIPLSIMRELALKSGLELDFASFDRQQNSQYEVPAELAPAKAMLQRLALENDRAHRQAITLTTAPFWQLVRNKYLHRSAQLGDVANDERRNAQHLPERQFIAG